MYRDLEEQAQYLIEFAQRTWKKSQRIEPLFMVWPDHPITDHRGNTITEACCLFLGEIPEAKWPEMFKQAIELADGCALALLDEHDENVRVLFEAPYGTRCWIMKKVRRGDVEKLEEAKESKNQEFLGLFWRPKMARA